MSDRSRIYRSAIFTALLLVASAGCVGYQIGSRAIYPVDVQTVHVPVFESSSFRRDLGERLTEAVVKEIERRTPYKVVGDPNADTMLTGKLTGENKHTIFQQRTGDPREMETNLHVQVNWIDRRGNMIRQGPAIPVPGECVSMQASSLLVPEVGQSLATSQQKAIVRLARQIVSMMEAPW